MAIYTNQQKSPTSFDTADKVSIDHWDDPTVSWDDPVFTWDASGGTQWQDEDKTPAPIEITGGLYYGFGAFTICTQSGGGPTVWSNQPKH